MKKTNERWSIQSLTTIAILIALQVVLARFLSFRTPWVVIGFGFVPIAVAGMRFGAVSGALVAGLGDIIGATLFPTGAFFPGFTLTAVLTGLVYGLILHKKVSFARIVITISIISLLFNLVLDTYWIMLLTGKGAMVLLPTRLIKTAILMPVQIVVVQLIDKSVMQYFKASYI